MTNAHNESVLNLIENTSVLTTIENASVLTTIDRVSNNQSNDNKMNENAYPRTETIISDFQNDTEIT